VLVHGAGSARWSFDVVRPFLESDFTVLAVDRRGRGDSDDGDGYALEREVDDLDAVLADSGERPYLVGHSYGGLISAAAIARLGEVAGLVLYEPPAGGVLAAPERIDEWDAQIAAGEVEEFLFHYMQEVGGYTAAQVDAFRATPAWRERVEIAPTVPRELRAEHAFRPDLDALAAFTTPTLLLLGSESPPWAVRSTEIYAQAFPNVTVRPLDGHGHAATVTGPELLAREITEFRGTSAA
jgi:pimeloyl-ACP methyl ester carboxylesterase